MDWSSWFRRTLLKNDDTNNTSTLKQSQKKQSSKPEVSSEEEERFGITQQLIDHVKSFTLDTFKNFPLPEDEGATGPTFNDETSTTTAASANVQKDLSEWQERHAMLVLSKVKELSQLRFKLCPGWLKERDFWRIYFTLVKSDVAEYELRAIQAAKLKRMTMEKEKEKEKPSDTGTVEVELAETKKSVNLVPSTP